ncbi:hypothetical protein [Parafilimonas terrae]|jgi:hypothetical protein|uniref:Uncharacterized protein n=1 Tax=Parafilimonas terrae TaxID=1465490 RepID=A0A1I5Z9M6_9BACT|nr:hypothetical protein [Parafilimonas terrae]SFQ53088.1 hypothetical protein SAMN05444277_1187 [Parafilimonas terrae]
MKAFLAELKRRNTLLYWYGVLSFTGAFICILMTQLSGTVVLGISAWIKPAKFFISVAVYCWTMAWIMHYLIAQHKVTRFSKMVLLVMTYELFVITWQAANGRLSHFNTTTIFYRLLFILMGAAISVLAAWTGYIGYMFFKQKKFTISNAYIWGIRLGIILFVIFSFEGGVMGMHLAHTVGAPDGGEGLPVINWSKRYGDLRIAHFAGMHALQVLPLFGFFIAKNKRGVQLFAAVYFLLTTLLFIQAAMGIPLLF